MSILGENYHSYYSIFFMKSTTDTDVMETRV